MYTDKHVYQIFELYPQWLFELTGLRSPGQCRFLSLSLKAIERRADGVIIPEAEQEPLSVVELQMQPDRTVYNRIAIEMALIQEQYDQREVQGILIFLAPELDPDTAPWNKIVHVFYLTQILDELSSRSPDHPLVALFKPITEENLQTLEKWAVTYYNRIKGFELAEASRSKLLDVFVNWLEQRFRDRGKKEIETMLLGELPDLRETQSGKDLIAIGRQEGERAGLLWLLEAKFGALDSPTKERINAIDSVERLKDLYRQVLAVASIDQLRW